MATVVLLTKHEAEYSRIKYYGLTNGAIVISRIAHEYERFISMEIIDVNNEFQKLQHNLKSYLYRLSANKEDAEDILQDTYIRVVGKFNTFKHESSFKTWVFAIATNIAKDNRRVRNRWALNAQDICKETAVNSKECQQIMKSAFSEQEAKSFEITEHINYCFTCISKNLILEQQLAVVLKEIYHFKRKEIAVILHKKEVSVKHLLYEGRKKLISVYENRCALINKNGVCYQCSELNDYFQEIKDSENKIAKLGFNTKFSPRQNLKTRFELIQVINPLSGNGANLEDAIMRILRTALNDC